MNVSMSIGMPVWPGDRMNWMLLFAREPEPEVEFTEEDLEEPARPRSSSPKTPKRSGGRPLLWVLLLVLAGGAAYLSLEPEMMMDLLSPILGETTQHPQIALPPSKPGAPPKTAPTAAAPAPSPTSTAPDPALPAPAITPTNDPAGGVQPTGASPVSPAPLFGEGQRVTVILDPVSPSDSITMSLDSAGTRPGSPIRPGITLIVLDGEFLNNNWMYAVRTEDGSKGWVPEKRLRLKF